MSLIEEALRRVKEPIPGPQDAGAPAAHSWPVAPSRSIPQQPAVARSSQNSLAIVAMTVLGLAALLLIGGMAWMLVRNTAQPFVIAQPSSSVSSTLQAPAEDAPLAPSVSRSLTASGNAQGNLVLSGVVEGLGEPYVVINGMIVGVGDRIADAVVVAIQHGAVTLRRSDGSVTTLRVPR